MKYNPAQIRKALAAAAALGAALVANGVLSGTTALIVQAVISALGVFVVFQVENEEVV